MKKQYQENKESEGNIYILYLQVLSHRLTETLDSLWFIPQTGKKIPSQWVNR